MQQPSGPNPQLKILVFAALAALLGLSSCGYRERVQPVILPSASANAMMVNGVEMVAVSYEDSKAAGDA